MLKRIRICCDRIMPKEIDLEPLTLLYGCNGVGKTSLLHLIENVFDGSKHLIDGEIDIVEGGLAGDGKIIVYSNSKDNDVNADPNPYAGSGGYEADIIRRFASMERSEGENVYESFVIWIGHQKFNKGDTLLLDEMDSGLSAELINALMWDVSDLVNKGVQVIMSINTYHPVFIFKKFLDMSTGKFTDCSKYDYGDFLKETLEIRKRKLGI